MQQLIGAHSGTDWTHDRFKALELIFVEDSFTGFLLLKKTPTINIEFTTFTKREANSY
tara:strand:+ start:478 stop:651 length:174 start_codon:yes stop_codon:yes gene_type:complete